MKDCDKCFKLWQFAKALIEDYRESGCSEQYINLLYAQLYSIMYPPE